jgi:hypothetical protein
MIATALTLLALAAPARVQVAAAEYGYSLSRPTIVAGPAIVELVNYGEDAHDLRLRRAGGTRTYIVGKVRPGGRAELEARFRPGRFTLWCSLADHRRRGMAATLVVRRA